MTVKQLKEWLEHKPGDLRIEVMIETDNCQYQFEATDFALCESKNKPEYVVIMHEKWTGNERE